MQLRNKWTRATFAPKALKNEQRYKLKAIVR